MGAALGKQPAAQQPNVEAERALVFMGSFLAFHASLGNGMVPPTAAKSANT